MYVSNRKQDVMTNRRVEYIMDSLYAMLGWSYWRPHEVEWDKRGVDVVLQIPGTIGKLWVDEKAAVRYWDKPLNTYACELTCTSTKNGYGWFAKENNDYMVNTHLVLIWVRALEKELIHISSLRFLVVNKHDLQKYFMLATGMTEKDDTKEYLEGLSWDDSGRCVINEHLTLKRCDIYPEYPVNAIFSKEILEKLSVEGGDFSRFSVRDALRSARESRLTEDAAQNLGAQD